MTGKIPDDAERSFTATEDDESFTSPDGVSVAKSASTTDADTDSVQTLHSDAFEAEPKEDIAPPEENSLPEDSSFDISSLAFDASALTKETSMPSSGDDIQQQENNAESLEEDAKNTITSSVTVATADVAATSYTETEEEEEEETEDEEEKKDSMSLRDHLRELRKRLFLAVLWVFLGFLPCYAIGTELFLFLKQPLIDSLPAGSDIIFTGVADGFFTELKISFLAGLFLTSPMVFYQIWSFIAPGLYKEEKVFILPVAVFSSLFFIGGAAFCYYVTFPFAFRFFLSYNSEHMKAMLSATEYLGFSLQLLFAFGVVFELPVFTFFLSRIGIVTAALMRKFRRYAALVIIIIAAILTPPDVISQLMMAFPLLVLYEISILIAVVFGKKPPVPEEETTKTEAPA